MWYAAVRHIGAREMSALRRGGRMRSSPLKLFYFLRDWRLTTTCSCIPRWRQGHYITPRLGGVPESK